MPTFGSLFSGVGGLDLGLERAGWECRWQVEIDPWRRGILERHWPGVPRHADIRSVHAREDVGTRWDMRAFRATDSGRCLAPTDGEQRTLGRVDLICGGFPCQDVSIAGRRAGLAGERSGLFHEFARIAEALRPQWLLIENVPGLLSSNGGRDFGVVLGTLADLGYGVAWRVLDSRFFGVPQRRRRVFIVGTLPGGDSGAQRASEVLAIGESCERHPTKGRTPRPRVAGTLEGGTPERGWRIGADEAGGGTSLSGMGSGGPDDNDGQAGRLVAHSLMSEGHDASEDGTGRGTPLAVTLRMREGKPGGGKGPLISERESLTLGKANDQVVFPGVRRLTPVECCRLQGFPDNWLGEPNEPPDSPRYAAMGDAVTVPVAEWIGKRLREVEG